MDIKDFKGHIFDLDGTLTRSNHVWSKIDEEFLGKRGIKVPEAGVCNEFRAGGCLYKR